MVRKGERGIVKQKEKKRKKENWTQRYFVIVTRGALRWCLR